jgi:hypothetical protein
VCRRARYGPALTGGLRLFVVEERLSASRRTVQMGSRAGEVLFRICGGCPL